MKNGRKKGTFSESLSDVIVVIFAIMFQSAFHPNLHVSFSISKCLYFISAFGAHIYNFELKVNHV